MSKVITALKAQKRNKQRVSVYLDGEYAFGLSRIVAAWLQVGQELDEQKINELQQEDGSEVAYQRALNFLSYRPRSEHEVIANLRKHETSQEDIDIVLGKLRRSNLVNDSDFAKLWVENRSEFRPRGRFALRVELRQKGVADDTIEAAIENIEEETLAYRAADKKAGKLKDLPWLDFRKKMSGFLSRRGFSYGIISSVVPRVWESLKHTIVEDELDLEEASEVLK
ncbi:MAG: RecX family transcriptional regulator [Anaerolineae bacterium]|nr:RecX family transcriptional regulator [Anaerolineae bacterium]